MKGSNFGLFLDRDGTINIENHYIKRPEDLQLIPGSALAIKEARKMGLKVIVVSNQSGIGRGLMTEEEVNSVNDRLISLLRKEGTDVDDIYFCPHHSEQQANCGCRKPDTGMFTEAGLKHDIDLPHSFMVGDRLSDMQAGRRIGAKTILVLTGYGSTLRDGWGKKPDVIDLIVPALHDSLPYIRETLSFWRNGRK